MIDIVRCVRAGIEMSKEQWLSLPLELRQRYWRDTDWGKRPPSPEMVAEVTHAFNEKQVSAVNHTRSTARGGTAHKARRIEMNDQDKQQYLAVRKEAGLKIDPETAEVEWTYAQTLDPYGIEPELPEEYWQVGREYFARSPGSDVWVHFGDLPDATRDALWQKHKSHLAFPAGLPWAERR